eukprot:scaffold11493_cov221-Amphora_coffeaeformis.AAC.4
MSHKIKDAKGLSLGDFRKLNVSRGLNLLWEEIRDALPQCCSCVVLSNGTLAACTPSKYLGSCCLVKSGCGPIYCRIKIRTALDCSQHGGQCLFPIHLPVNQHRSPVLAFRTTTLFVKGESNARFPIWSIEDFPFDSQPRLVDIIIHIFGRHQGCKFGRCHMVLCICDTGGQLPQIDIVVQQGRETMIEGLYCLWTVHARLGGMTA